MAADDEPEGGEAGERPRGDASEKQLNFIRSLQKRMSLQDDELEAILEEVCGAHALEDLGRKDASEVIDELQVRAREKGIDLDAQPKASDKQVSFMKQLKRRAHLTDDEFASFLQDRAGVTDAADVGKRDASTIIDELLKLADGKGKPGGAAPAKKADAPAARKKAPGGRQAAEKKAPARAASPAKKPADDDDRPPERGPPPDVDDYEPGGFDDGPDDEDLDRDPGGDDDDLPF